MKSRYGSFNKLILFRPNNIWPLESLKTVGTQLKDFQSQKRLYIHKCLFISLSVWKQNPPTAENQSCYYQSHYHHHLNHYLHHHLQSSPTSSSQHSQPHSIKQLFHIRSVFQTKKDQLVLCSLQIFICFLQHNNCWCCLAIQINIRHKCSIITYTVYRSLA